MSKLWKSMTLYRQTLSLTYCARTADHVIADYGSFTPTHAGIFTKIMLRNADVNGLDQV